VAVLVVWVVMLLIMSPVMVVLVISVRLTQFTAMVDILHQGVVVDQELMVVLTRRLALLLKVGVQMER